MLVDVLQGKKAGRRAREKQIAEQMAQYDKGGLVLQIVSHAQKSRSLQVLTPRI
jgi:hypothetical protein